MMQDPRLQIDQAAFLRRGMVVSWEWGTSGRGATAQADGLRPMGRIITEADHSAVPGMGLGIQVLDDPDWVIDANRALALGRALYLEKAVDPPKVLNAHHVGRNVAGAVYIGRPSNWGNPFEIGKDGDREDVMRKYIQSLHDQPEFLLKIRRELVGKDLICWCDPAPCHGHILRDIAMGAPLPEIPVIEQPDMFQDY